MLLALFSLAGCVDVVHYISFNDRGQTVSSVRIGFASALLESGSEGEELKEKFSNMTNKAFSEKTEDANIKETNFIVSNSAIYGVQSLRTAPKHYFAASNQVFFPVKESYGFSLKLGDALKNSEEFEGMRESAEMGGILAVMFKYRILLSKADLPRPLTKAVLTSPGGMEVAMPLTDYGVMYHIDVPFQALMEASKMEFHFAPK